MKRIMSFGAALALVLASAVGRAEATEYILTTIHYPGADDTWAMGINDSGQIVGQYEVGGRSHGFTWSGGVFTSFDHPTAASGGSGAYDINNSGQIVGWYDKVGSNTYGAYLRDGATYHELTPFGSSMAFAWGINDLTNVVGYYRDAGGVDRGFLFDGTSHTRIDDPDAVSTNAWGINNAGVIVGGGFHESTVNPTAFIRDVDGTYTEFQISGWDGDATGINDSGQIVGRYGPSPDDHYGFVLSGGVGSTLDTLQAPGATITEAWDINDLGQVVGRYTNGTYYDGPYRGFLATPIAAADFDKDGDVDGDDLTMWQGDYGLTANCDADGDGDTDGRDFLIWQRQYIAGIPGLANELAIPEPATLLLALMALAGSVRAARNTS